MFLNISKRAVLQARYIRVTQVDVQCKGKQSYKKKSKRKDLSLLFQLKNDHLSNSCILQSFVIFRELLEQQQISKFREISESGTRDAGKGGI